MTNTTWNPSDKTNVTLSGTNNLTATSSATQGAVRTIDRQITGKYYFEYTGSNWSSSFQTGVGVANVSANLGGVVGTPTNACLMVSNTGKIYINGSDSGSTLSARSAGDIIGVALDCDNTRIWFRVAPSGNWNGSGTADPATNVGGVSFISVKPVGFPIYGCAGSANSSGQIVIANFGDTAFSGTVPSGFTSGFSIGTPPSADVVTQSSIEQWTAPIPDMQFTQAAVEEWASAWPNLPLTGLAGTGGVGSLSTVSGVPTPAFVLSGSRPGIGSVAVRDGGATGTTSVLVGIGVETDTTLFGTGTLPGVSFTAFIGTLTRSISDSKNLTGVTAAWSVGTMTALSGVSADVNLTGVSFAGSAGTLGQRESGTLIGVSLSSAVGTASLTQITNISLTGNGAQFTLAGQYLYDDLRNVIGGFPDSSHADYLFNSFTWTGLITVTSITSVSLSNSVFAGGVPSGTVVGTISVAMNTGSFTGTLSLSGTNAASFRISGSNLVTFGVLASGPYSLNVIATQTGVDSYTQAFSLTATAAAQTITNVTLSNTSFIGSSPSGTLVGVISVPMNTGTFSGSLSLSGPNAASFQISGSNLLTNGIVPVGTYGINIIATQTGAAGSPFTRAFSLTASRAMTNITLSSSSFLGGSPNHTTIGTIAVVMSSGTFGGTLALSGANASSFRISGSNLQTVGVVPTGSYAINITATQAGITGSPLLKAFAITATAPAPSITNVTLSPATFAAGLPSGSVVGAIAVTMSSGAFTGTLSLSGTNAASFSISGSNLVTNGVLATGTYNINIIATQTGATGSPFTKAVAVVGSTSITNITLSNSSFAGGSAANTLVGTIAVTMSSGAFAGTLTLSGTNAASFHISGSNLLTTGVVPSGSYAINIIATQPGASGSPFTRAFSITGTGASSWLTTPPPQAAAAGFNNLAFYDDFLSASTITLTNSTAQRAFKWYPASWGGNLSATNVQVNTTWTAGDANMTAQGVSGAGPNASPSGGIVRVQGGASNAALISVDGWISTFPTSGTFKYGYAEAYIQYRPTDVSANSATVGWPAWWSWTMEAIQSLGFGGSIFNASPTEIDFWEYGKTTNGNWAGMAFHWSMSGGIDALRSPGFTIDNNWHTIGMLWTPGVVTFYYDNVHVGGSFTSSSLLEAGHLFLMLGSGQIVTPQSATEPVPMYVDWVRCWTGGGAPLPTLTVDLTSTTGNTLYKTLFGSSMARDVDFTPWQDTNLQTAARTTAGFNMTGMFARANCENAAFTAGSPNLGYVDIVSAAIHNIITVPTSASSVYTNTGIFSYGLGGGTTDPTTYANAAKAIAQRFVANGTPVYAYEVNNETDGSLSDAQYCAIFNATADALHTVDSSILVGGMNYSFMSSGSYHTFATTCGSRIGYLTYHSYSVDPSFTDAAAMQQAITRFGNDAAGLNSAVAGTAAANLPRCVGEYNMDGAPPGDPRQTGIVGAVFNMLGLHTAFTTDPLTRFGHLWDWQGDSYYGMVINPTNNPAGLPSYSVTPVGYALKGARQYMGGSVITSTLSSGNIKVLSTKSGTQWAILLINYDTGGVAATSLNISLLHATTIGSTVTRYEVSAANPSSATSTITSSSLTNVSIPSTSVVILSGTFT